MTYMLSNPEFPGEAIIGDISGAWQNEHEFIKSIIIADAPAAMSRV